MRNALINNKAQKQKNMLENPSIYKLNLSLVIDTSTTLYSLVFFQRVCSGALFS